MSGLDGLGWPRASQLEMADQICPTCKGLGGYPNCPKCHNADLRDAADEGAESRRSAIPCSLFLGLIGLVQESTGGDWRCSLDYDNYQDGARVMDGDGNVIGECYELWPEEMGVDEGVAWQFSRAIERALHSPANASVEALQK